MDRRNLTEELDDLGLSPKDLQLARDSAISNHTDLDLDRTVLSFLLDDVKRSPRRVCLIEGSTTHTAESLLSRAIQIARLLRELGCAQGDVIGLAGSRSSESVALFLAIEILGGVYMPLDPSWPERRLVAVLDRTLPMLILEYHADSPREDTLGPLRRAAETSKVPIHLLYSHIDPSWPPAEADHGLDLRLVCEDPAEWRCIFLTSGTTGTPKASVVEHRGVLNHCWAKIEATQLGEEDLLAFTAPLTFDIAIWQVVAPILVRCKTVVLNDATVAFPRGLCRALRVQSVTVLELVPTVAGWLAEEVERTPDQQLPALASLLSTGEALTPARAARILDAMPHVRLVNAYGFTETSDDVAHWTVTIDEVSSGAIPVGIPIANSSLYVLVRDANGWRAAPPGEDGELFVGGIPVSPGYLGDAFATKSAYFHDQIDRTSATRRLFKTGDAVVIRDGVLYCLGRLDRQVKVSGVRIELNEIEAMLENHPLVDNSAVILDETTEPALVKAFYVARSNSVDQLSLRQFLSLSIPASMIPKRWQRVRSLPLSRNGKIDYSKLS